METSVGWLEGDSVELSRTVIPLFSAQEKTRIGRLALVLEIVFEYRGQHSASTANVLQGIHQRNLLKRHSQETVLSLSGGIV